MNVLVLNIKTVPDVQSARKLYALEGLQDKEVENVLYHKRMQETEANNLLFHLNQVVSIGVCLRTDGSFFSRSLMSPQMSEKEMLAILFDMKKENINKVISWNGDNFDIPILQYRALLHGVNSKSICNWTELTEADDAVPQHVSLSDIFFGDNQPAQAPLDEVAAMLGFPTIESESKSIVWDAYQNGDMKNIHKHCSYDVLNTYLVYLRCLLTANEISDNEYEQEINLVKTSLHESNTSHFNVFVDNWEMNDG